MCRGRVDAADVAVTTDSHLRSTCRSAARMGCWWRSRSPGTPLKRSRCFDAAAASGAVLVGHTERYNSGRRGSPLIDHKRFIESARMGTFRINSLASSGVRLMIHDSTCASMAAVRGDGGRGRRSAPCCETRQRERAHEVRVRMHREHHRSTISKDRVRKYQDSNATRFFGRYAARKRALGGS